MNAIAPRRATIMALVTVLAAALFSCADLSEYHAAEQACDMGAWDRCEQDMDSALATGELTYEEQARALFLRGQARLYQEKYGDAYRDLEKSAELGYDDPTLFAFRGVARQHVGAFQAAMDDYGAAMAMVPDEEVKRLILFHRGVLYAATRHYEEAEQDLTDLLAGGPLPPSRKYEALMARGKARLRTNKLDGALKDLDAAIDLDPEHPEAYRVRAMVWRTRGENDRGMDDLRKASALDDSPASAPLP